MFIHKWYCITIKTLQSIDEMNDIDIDHIDKRSIWNVFLLKIIQITVIWSIVLFAHMCSFMYYEHTRAN